MSQVLDFFLGYSLPRISDFHSGFTKFQDLPQIRPCLSYGKSSDVQKCKKVQSLPKALNLMLAEAFDGSESDILPHVQTLRSFPEDELIGKVGHGQIGFDHLAKGAEETAVSSCSWSLKADPQFLKLEYVAEFLSSELELKVMPVELGSGFEQSLMEERHKTDILLLENLSQFKQDVDIFVNDAFFQSHKILASNVGITGFFYASIAGFHFDEGMSQLKKIIEMNKRPYFAIIGGANLSGKAAALFLASRCDGLVFVGDAAFQIMHAFGLPVPMELVEHESLRAAHMLVEAAKARGVQIVLPKDFGWKPVDVGPNTLEEMISMLSRCKKILLIGAVKFSSSNQESAGASKLFAMLYNVGQKNCDVIVVSKQACETFFGKSTHVTAEMIENASIVWEFLKGRKLHGLLELDRAYPFKLNWDAIYANTTLPLFCNGLFLSRMAKMRKDWNFLGLEINEKLVSRCLDHVSQSGMTNRYFIAAKATSTFRSIVSSYPGDLVLVSIQFNKTEHRWRMVQRSLVEAIADLLSSDGKFMKYGKGKLTVVHDLEYSTTYRDGWLKENPFGIRSDWEQHVIDRGAPMYRLLLLKSSSSTSDSCNSVDYSRTKSFLK
ncbi:unnamed protein product [Withania somnifera]